MDLATVIGVIMGLIAVGVGMVLKGVDISVLANPAADTNHYHWNGCCCDDCVSNVRVKKRYHSCLKFYLQTRK